MTEPPNHAPRYAHSESISIISAQFSTIPSREQLALTIFRTFLGLGVLSTIYTFAYRFADFTPLSRNPESPFDQLDAIVCGYTNLYAAVGLIPLAFYLYRTHRILSLLGVLAVVPCLAINTLFPKLY